MNYIVLDTCIVVHLLKKSAIADKMISELHLDEKNIIPIISSVTKGELLSFAKQRNWGERRIRDLDQYLSSINFVDVTYGSEDLHSAYALIDAYSKQRANDGNGQRLNGSARKMGKNDLWIAATAAALKAPLITTDGDYDHLKDTFLEIKKYTTE